MNKPEKTQVLDETLRVTLRCGGKGGRCASPVLVPFSMLDSPAKLKTMLEEAEWGVVSYAITHQGAQIPVVDPACPECFAEYQKAQQAATEAAAASSEATETAPAS
jgi:hypothetical protein